MDPSEVLDLAEASLPRMLEELRTLVGHESPTREPESVDRASAYLASLVEGLPCRSTWVTPDGDFGRHLVVDFGEGTSQTLMVSHLDTVWPIGTLATMPFRIDGDLAYGPGIADMKGGVVVALAALRILSRLGVAETHRVRWLITSDEEVGSPSSRRLIEDAARSSRRVLVTEPGDLPNGAVKTRRKGTGRFEVHVRGVAAHAGAAHQDGASAIRELAHQINVIEELTDYEAGTTANVGVVKGGLARNVVPAEASMSIDMRFVSDDEMRRLKDRMRELRPVNKRTVLTVEGGFDRPPMTKTAVSADLYQEACSYAERLGFELPETFGGGASDANFCSALGLPTLDGLGAVGAGFHAVDERISVASLPKRAALLALLLSTPSD